MVLIYDGTRNGDISPVDELHTVFDADGKVFKKIDIARFSFCVSEPQIQA